jgi:hypothetical protein
MMNIPGQLEGRTSNCIAKLDRMNKALRHEEADRVPVSDFFWGSFLKRWREEMGLAPDTDIYKYYDLDWIVTVPNLDPHIRQFEILRESEEEVVVRTGFEAILRKKLKDPMPEYVSFETDTLEKMAAFQFDDPWDDRRFFSGGGNQISGVGDGFTRNLPPWMETVKSLRPDIPVYGSVAEAHETLWRIVGSNNVLLWIGLYPDELTRFIERVSAYVIELTKAQIHAADGKLDGMVIWGDVAYTRDMLFSPDFWRTRFKPCVTEIVRICHEHGIPVIYHGCGNVKKILPDFIETGIDAYNPLEAKAGLDVVELRRQYGHQLGFCGNMDVLTWANADMDTLKGETLRKLNAAKGGGMIFQSDHSVPSSISGPRYEQVVQWVREYGRYPLQLGPWDVDMGK